MDEVPPIALASSSMLKLNFLDIKQIFPMSVVPDTMPNVGVMYV